MIMMVADIAVVALRLYLFAVIAWIILDVLIQFRIVNAFQPTMRKVTYWLNRSVLPALRPVRRMLPNTGMLDFSPIVLLLLVQFAIDCVIAFFIYPARFTLSPIANFATGLLFFAMVSFLVYGVLLILLRFNVINYNQMLVQVLMDALERLLRPALNPVRKLLPRIAQTDLSPLAVALLLYIAIDLINIFIRPITF